jgi:hypothetical protein
MQIPKAYTVLESTEEDALICRIEIVPKQCVTIFGRVRDSEDKWRTEMDALIATINPEVTAHFDELTRRRFHPKGSPKKTGYKYFHHCHIPWSEAGDTLPKLEQWMPKRFKLVKDGE